MRICPECYSTGSQVECDCVRDEEGGCPTIEIRWLLAVDALADSYHEALLEVRERLIKDENYVIIQEVIDPVLGENDAKPE